VVYRGTDLSETMVTLARERLHRFGNRVEIVLTDGSLISAVVPASVDVFVATYVLDLLPDEDIRGVLAEATRVLRPGGPERSRENNHFAGYAPESIRMLQEAIERM
jgi:ubiquinone/menaquinone biosynthesis C-methylase UbiE